MDSTIRDMPALDGIPDWVTEEDIKNAFTVAEVGRLTTAERIKWETAFREDTDLRGQVLQQYIYGMMKVKEEGREEGREEEFQQLAIQLKQSGLEIETIAKMMKLDIEHLNRLLSGID